MKNWENFSKIIPIVLEKHTSSPLNKMAISKIYKQKDSHCYSLSVWEIFNFMENGSICEIPMLIIPVYAQ